MRKIPNTNPIYNHVFPLDASRQFWELPWPRKAAGAIWPIFLPFLGCPAHCIFCGQEAQTGGRCVASLEELERLLEHEAQGLAERKRKGLPPPQLAFYGGTFTAMADKYLHLCLRTASQWRTAGLINGFRCSTRPDCLNADIMGRMRDSGCQLVELGIQSFAPEALRVSGRGYTPEQALEAMAMLRDAGLGPGIQLLPGMPGSVPADFLGDVRLAIQNGAVCLRFYPCVVLDGTGLAPLWKRGVYTPWSLTRTLDQLTQGWLMAAEEGIPVIRMGLSPQKGMRMLAGPWHEALGSRVMGRALALFVARCRGRKGTILYVPKHAQGCFWGWRQELAEFWGRQRIKKVYFWQRDCVRLEWEW